MIGAIHRYIRDTSKPLTKKQQSLYDAIVWFWGEHKMSPTQQELSNITGLHKYSIRMMLDVLVKRHYITKLSNTNRGIYLL